MSTMIERAGRAIADHLHNDGDYGMRGEDAYAAGKGDFDGMARAAIEAVREPSEVVVMAGRTEAMVSGMGPRGMKQCYATMIDAILAESPPPASSGRSEG